MVSEKVRTFAPAKKKDAPVAQLVEHLTLNQGVQSSSLCGCTFLCFAPVAQLVEHLTLNQGVQSSSLCGCTSLKRLPIWLSWKIPLFIDMRN